MKLAAVIFSALLTLPSLAAPRTSANYSVTAESADSGGRHAASSSYINDGSIGGLAGLATVASPGETAKIGYIGQIYEVTALQVSATPGTIDETGTLQLSGAQLLDDLTTISVSAGSISWNVASGPLTGISGSGLATAGTVSQDTAATVQGTFAGANGTLNLTVLDTIKDNFGSYAGDGLPDAWQVQYFGQNNPNAAPGVVTDGSGLSNFFKYTAGLIPNDAVSKFTLNVSPVNGQPGQMNIVFAPSLSDRSYTIQSSTDLTHWDIFYGPFAGNDGTQTVTDSNVVGPKFYRVQITH